MLTDARETSRIASAGRAAADVMPSADDTTLPDGPELSASEISFRWLAHPYEFLDACAAAHGEAFTLRFAHFGTHVVVAHPDDVRAALTADCDVLSAGRGNALLEPILGVHSMLLVDGERHLAQRALLQPAFRMDQMPTYARSDIPCPAIASRSSAATAAHPSRNVRSESSSLPAHR